MTEPKDTEIVGDVDNEEKAEQPKLQQKDVDDSPTKAVAAPAPGAAVDGGVKVWIVAFGGFCCLFASTGWIYSIGVLQDYYQENQYKNLPASTIAWTQSLESGLVWFMGLFVGILFSRYGARPLLIVGTLLHIFGLMMLSLSKRYWQTVLSQGLCSPIGAGLLYNTAMFAAPPWFGARRALGMGVVLLGASVGSIITPILVSHVLVELGFPWAVRITAFMYLFFCIIGILTVESRYPPNPTRIPLAAIISPFKEPIFNMSLAATFLAWFAVFIPYNFMLVQARTRVGMSANLAQYLLPICSTFGIPGRIIPTLLADRYGRFNVTTIVMLLISIVILACWIPAHSNAVVIVFAALYGFLIGGYPPLAAALVPHITKDQRTVPLRLGLQFLVASIPMITGNPIAGAILNAQHGTFWGLQLFAGLMMFVSAVLYVVTRMMFAGWKLSGKV